MDFVVLAISRLTSCSLQLQIPIYNTVLKWFEPSHLTLSRTVNTFISQYGELLTTYHNTETKHSSSNYQGNSLRSCKLHTLYKRHFTSHLSFLLVERTVEAAVLLALSQLREQRPRANSLLLLGLRARSGLSVRTHLHTGKS